ncbi:O-antigen ligase family protein [Chelativorans sp. AA-79]|uniref:O-antigen ligase family protein n=1 Tax=Chelativorans sp. AA-79 TaxID=3028735 RepID=UPI0023F96CA8|nr:O-antigen ligase family protein [Chelativorans sp. AA-79]WEX11736.1 O-antigen ligase family protein [Chelativorans sp. AA-79]
MSSTQHGRAAPAQLAKDMPAYAVLLVFLSAVWVESDAYRYAALATLLPVTVYYFYKDFLSDEKVLIGYMGFACIGWGLYVVARFFYSYSFHGNFGIGSSEGIYIFPLLYPISGYALFLFIRRPLVVACCFLLISFLVALYSLDLPAVVGGYRTEVVLHANPIHAAVGQGMIVLCMLPFANYLLQSSDMRPGLRAGLTVLSIATLFLGLANIYALESKGVWLALAIALPVQLLMIATVRHARRALLVIVFLSFAVLAATVVAAWDGILAVAGDTAEAAAKLLAGIFGDANVLEDVDRAIHDDALPGSFRERLMLWASAILIWAKDPIFGQGVTWLHEWQTRAYPAADYNLIHNGYLEIAIRYGIVGLTFYAVLFFWAIRQVWRAKREGVVDPAAFQAYVTVFLFFCITIFSNSNIRLALGESYMWFSAAFGFYCYYHLQKRNAVKVATWM